MKKIIFLYFTISAFYSVAAQGFDFTPRDKYSWEEKPKMHTINKSFDSASAVCIYDERQAEYKKENKDLDVFYTFHKIFFIKDDRGIELLNKLYIPINPESELVRVKLRVVYKNGKVNNIDSATVKTIDEDGKKYAIFAVEGLEKGCEFEYNYIIKYPLFLFDSELFQFSNYPCQEARFSLIAPSYLRFSAKGYNGMKVSADSLVGDVRIISGFDKDIPLLETEKYAYRKQYLKRIDFKLSYNLNTSPNTRLYTWKDLAKKVYARYTERNDKEEKSLESFMTHLNLPKSDDLASQIVYLEDYIKTNYNYDEKLLGDNAGQLDNVISTKSANLEGICKLYSAVFDKAGINFQFVFPTNRTDYPIDEELEYWNRIDEVVIYFPSTGKYLSPINIELRYPFIPFALADSRGLFLKGTTIGNFRTAVGAFGTIKMEPFSQHSHNMEIDVSFQADMDSVLIKCAQIFRGYGAHSIRPVYSFLSKEKQEEVTQELIKPIVKSTIIKNTKIENTALTDGGITNKPLIIYGEASSSELIETAGKKILFKIGDLIGPQVQMYQENARQMPIELDYPHELNRRIIFHIPEGYSIENPKDLLFDVTHRENNEITMGFSTHYTIKGNELELFIEETYFKTHYPLEQFLTFQKVINASADFNKVTLVLSRK